MAGFGEQGGTVIDREGSVLELKRVFEPHGESLADWEVLRRLPAGRGLSAPDDLESIQEEIRKFVPQPATMIPFDP